MNNFFVEPITEKDKELLNTWWQHWDYPGVPFDAYPKTTLMVYFGNYPVVSGSAYQTDSPIVYMDNVIANPGAVDDVRDLATDVLLKALVDESRKNGYKYWNANSKLKSIVERSKKFKLTQYGENHYWFTGEI